jgi:tetratricopeptide (TPR) repeat protein
MPSTVLDAASSGVPEARRHGGRETTTMSNARKKRASRHRPAPASPPSRSPQILERALLLALGVVSVVHTTGLRFVQDDSFITFRYVRNLLDGHGLVFNIGEHVEGYTNFLWTILLAIPAALGIDLVTVSHILGVGAGLAGLALLYLLSRQIGGTGGPFGICLVAVALTVSNGAVAYWSISGMESALFMALLLAVVFFYLKEYRHHIRLTPVFLVLLSLTRPEGMLVFGLTVLHYIAASWLHGQRWGRERLRELVRLVTIYALPMLLFLGWRLLYYGYPFPNTYYAKAGISSEYLQAGIDYFLFFVRTYLLYGFLLAAPILVLLWRRRSPEVSYLITLTLSYTLYIIVVGGDVLHAFRFFVPILPLIYLLLQESLRELLAMIPRPAGWVQTVPLALAALLGYYSYVSPRAYIEEKWTLERGLVSKMTATGEWLGSVAGPSTEVAASTIGALSYFSGVTLIDLLGLTDETIAHHPEAIEGVESGWKERKYNTSYVLSRQPSWIFFSTGSKPSAFAERALFTRAEFRRHYYPCFFHLHGDMNALNVAYKRSPESLVDSTRYGASYRSTSFINEFYIGMNMLRTPGSAFPFFEKARQEGPADFALLDQELGGAYRAVNNLQAAEESYRRAVAINPAMVESQIMLGLYARDREDYASAQEHFARVVHYNPEYTLGWTLLGESLLLQGDSSAARQKFERALSLTPNNTHARNYLARMGPPR